MVEKNKSVSVHEAPFPKAAEFKISRIFNAPRHLVFEAWSRAEYVSRWFTPAPLTTPSCEVDFRPGGNFNVTMKVPEGPEFPMVAKFVEIVPNERIIFLAHIHGDMDVFTTVTFEDTDDGKTLLSAHQIYSKDGEPTKGAPEGWNLTLNQLGEHIRSRA